VARARKPESAYERRIRRYLEQHPGATRQEARGHRPAKGRREYESRVERALARRPGITRQQAGGKQSLADFRRQIRPGDLVEVTDYDRDSQGEVTRVGLLVTGDDGREREYVLGRAALRRGGVESLLGSIAGAGAIDSPKYGTGTLFEHELDEIENELVDELEEEE
jgi:hypothetical protein